MNWELLFWRVATVVFLCAFGWSILERDHAARILRDQAVYIDAGCKGRYQGEEP